MRVCCTRARRDRSIALINEINLKMSINQRRGHDNRRRRRQRRHPADSRIVYDDDDDGHRAATLEHTNNNNLYCGGTRDRLSPARGVRCRSSLRSAPTSDRFIIDKFTENLRAFSTCPIGALSPGPGDKATQRASITIHINNARCTHTWRRARDRLRISFI